MTSDHYINCADPACPGCLPSDDEVRAMSIGKAKREAMRRGLPMSRASETIGAILDDADDYRTRAASARAERFDNAGA